MDLAAMAELIRAAREDQDAWLAAIPEEEDDPDVASRRQARLAELVARGVHASHDGATLHTRGISPNCTACLLGQVQAIRITKQCPLRCSFCYHDRHERAQPGHLDVSGLQVAAGVMAVGVTGGEPLLHFDVVVDALRLARERGLRAHLYTSGRLLDEARLRALRDAGLAEIRFDLAASGYRLLPQLRLARRFIPMVNVEIPVIPAHEEKVRNLLPRLDAVRIDVVNLNEWLVFPHSAAALAARGALRKSNAGVRFYNERARPIAGSEECAYRLLELALARLTSTSVHYCSYRAKSNCQHAAVRHRSAAARRRDPEAVDAEGFLWKLVVCEPSITRALEDLASHASPGQVQIVETEGGERRLDVAPDLLPLLRPDRYPVGRLRIDLRGLNHSLEILRADSAAPANVELAQDPPCA